MFLISGMWKHITGIILLPGSFSGSMSSPRPQRGPLCKRKDVRTTQQMQTTKSIGETILDLIYLPKKRMSFAIFMREAAIVFREPLVSTKASCAAYQHNKHRKNVVN